MMEKKRFQEYTTQAPGLLDGISSALCEINVCEQLLTLPTSIRKFRGLPWEQFLSLPLPADAKPVRTAQIQRSSKLLQPQDDQLRGDRDEDEVTISGFIDDRTPPVRGIEQPITTSSGVVSVLVYTEKDEVRCSVSLSQPAGATIRYGPHAPVPNTMDAHRQALCHFQHVLHDINLEQTITKGSHVVMLHYTDKKPCQLTKTYTLGLPIPTIHNVEDFCSSIPDKLHYMLPDKSTFIYYPSGTIAICQVPSKQGGLYTNIFSDRNHSLLGSFQPNGKGFIYHDVNHRSNWCAVSIGLEGGQERNTEGVLIKKWKFSQITRKIHHRYKVNENVVVSIRNDKLIKLYFSALDKAITLTVKKPMKDTMKKQAPQEDMFMTEMQSLRNEFKSIVQKWLKFYTSAIESHNRSMVVKRRLARATKVLAAPQPHDEYLLLTRSADQLPSFSSPIRTDLPPQMILTRSFPDFYFEPYSHMPVPWKGPPSPCPAVLRLAILKIWKGETCHCSVCLPTVTDLELDVFIQGRSSPPNNTIVVYITSYQHPTLHSEVQTLYRHQIRLTSSPCVKASQQSFRLVKYNVDSATQFTRTEQPLLVERHNVRPGAVLMYMRGSLVCAVYESEYGFSEDGLLKQISKAQVNFARGASLPDNHRMLSADRSPPHVQHARTPQKDSDPKRGPCPRSRTPNTPTNEISVSLNTRGWTNMTDEKYERRESDLEVSDSETSDSEWSEQKWYDAPKRIDPKGSRTDSKISVSKGSDSKADSEGSD